MDKKSKIILIAGPTASGKSNFAIKLAKKVDGEIINTDSMQIYKEIKILNARPKAKETKYIKHYLYGFHSVKKNFSTGDWLKKTIKLIKQINNKNWENTNRVTYRINGGQNGLRDRKKKFKAYKATLK